MRREEPTNQSQRPSTEPLASERTLSDSAIEGIRWIGAARFIAEAVAFAGSVVLARFVSPADFGRAAVALGIVATADAVATQLLVPSVVRARAPTIQLLRTAAFLAFAFSVIVVVVLLLLAWLVVAPLLGETIATYVALATPAVVATSIATISRAQLQRRLAFRTLGLIEIGALFAGVATSVLLATVFALDGEALVFGFVASNTAAAALAIAFAPWVGPRWGDRTAARELLDFGIPASGEALLASSFKSIDYLVLSFRLPAATVGYYWRAFSLAVDYQHKIGLIMQRVAFPVLSRAPDLVELRRLRVRMASTNAAVLFPLLATLVVVAPVLVPWLFGPAWEPSVVLTQILGGAGMATALMTGTPAFMLALGRPRPLVPYNVVAVVGLASVAYFAAPLGLTGVAVCVLAFYLFLLALNHVWLLHRIGGISLSALARECAIPLAACVPLALVELGCIEALSDRVSDFVLLLLAGSLGLATYALSLRVAFPRTWRTHRDVFLRIVGLRGRAALERSPVATGPERPTT